MSDLSVPKDLKEFHTLFPDSGACVAYLSKVRWPDGYSCPKCGLPAKGFRKTRGLIYCANDHQVSVTAGTALHRSKQPLWDWFYAAFLISTATPGVSAAQLQKQLGTRSYETAFMLLHKIRSALVDPERTPLKGEVEVNEAFIGGPDAGHHGREPGDKAEIVVGVEVLRWVEAGKQKQRAGRLRMSVIPNAQADTLMPWIQKNVEKGSLVVTDGLTSYKRLPGLGYAHRTMVPTRGDPNSYLPMAHLIVSNLKAWLLGTYHGAVDRKHLPAYLNEYVFRFNRRHWRGPAFLRCLRMLMASEPLEYQELYELTDYQHPNPEGLEDLAVRLYEQASPKLKAWIDANPEKWLESVRKKVT